MAVVVEPYIAIHEAGHLIAAWYCPTVTRIYSVRAGTIDGVVLYEVIQTSTAIAMWNDLVISVAGITAQLWVQKSARAGDSENDLVKAADLVKKLASMCVARVAFPIETSDRDSITRMYSRKFTADEAHLLEAAYLKARTILIRTEPDYYRVVNAIMTGATLDQKTLESLLGKRPRLDPGGTFALPPKSHYTSAKKSWGQRALKLLLEFFE